ncbi:Lipocalin family protein [Pseudoxanthomonas suwonensis 11-1]|uniref:Lipocalin family protein n=2 Tax=Pseudoxanthomonas suwonensis TaxID=314722 RepID=E6WT49_PSEUU|nr:Lipocalin family protein [Pseudoxanthomonas suwonensis 11-1]
MTTTAIVARAAWLFLLLVPLSVGARERAQANHLPLPVMDLGRFAGQWHHVAWLPVDLQRKCVRDSRVSLARVEEGFELRRSCVDSDGKLLEETADAVSVPGAPGSLQVRSAPRWRAWIPMGWSRRWVLAVDPSYQWALVGAPDQDHLWVLARQPHMDRTLLASLVERAQAMGYPVDELVFEPGAHGGEARRIPSTLVASTNEPFWQAKVEGAVVQLSGPALETPRRLPLVVREDSLVPGVQRIVARDAQGELVLRVAADPCQDSMSGAWFPLQASLSVDGQAAVAGCARPADLPAPVEPR